MSIRATMSAIRCALLARTEDLAGRTSATARRRAGTHAGAARDFLRPAGAWVRRLAVVVLLALAMAAPARASQPFIWDDDGDKLDDRMEQVHLLGYSFSFTNADTTQRQRFDVERLGGQLVYGVYVLFTAPPTAQDLAALDTIGMPTLHRFEAIPAVRSIATFPQAQAAALLPDVARIEVIPIVYGETREDAASIGARDPSEQVFPTWTEAGGADGSGVDVAILDTGVNDAADGAYPGHESLLGKWVGGAQFTQGDSALDTPRDGSVNPDDHGGPATEAHATHIAGIVLGTGGASGYAAGIAPGARLVDVKVLDDTGIGTGIGEALDWCIHNRDRDWGSGAHGIQVINLSVSSLDRSDGNDVVSQLAARAAALGIVVVASTGNDGNSAFIPAPASADGVLSVGAYDAQRTGAAGDDQFAPFSNAGPRDGNGDGDPSDEQKPDLVAPGVAVLSANGDLTTDGTKYLRMSGTSMSAAVVSGAVALLRSEFPALSPAQIATVLRETARRGLNGVPAGPAGADPRWNASIGWGAIDVYAARLELEQPQRSQIERLVLTAQPTEIDAQIWTQREQGASAFVLERAPDASGAPGTFAPIDSVAAAGDSSLATTDRTIYPITLAVPAAERGQAFWYRVAYTEAGRRWNCPAREFASPVGPAVAEIRLRIVHDAYDHDLGGAVTVVTGAPNPPSFPLPGTSAADSSDLVDGTSNTGTIAWSFTIPVPAGVADAYLPATALHPWKLTVTDGGYLDRSGRIDAYSIVWHGPDGDVTTVGGPAPEPTLEGLTVQANAPMNVEAVGAAPAAAFRAGPNPVRAGAAVSFATTDGRLAAVDVFDLTGREVGRAAFAPGATRTATWIARDTRGAPLPAGVYFARAGAQRARVVVLKP